MVSVTLLSRATVKRMVANFAGVMSLLDVMRAFCTRKAVTPSMFLIVPELEDRAANSSGLGRVVVRVFIELAPCVLVLGWLFP